MSPSHDGRAVGPHWDVRSARRAVFGLALAVGLADFALPSAVAVEALYLLPVLASLWGGRRGFVIATAWGTVALAVFGELFEARGIPGGVDLANLAVAVFAILVTLSLGLWRLRMEAELKESRLTTAKTLESIADGVITTDTEDRVTFLNRSAAELLEWDEREAIGLPLGEVFPAPGLGSPRTDEDEESDEPVEAGEVWEAGAAEAEEDETTGLEDLIPGLDDVIPNRREVTLCTRSGRTLVLEASAASISIPGEKVAYERPGVGRVLVFRDVTARRERQEWVEALAYRDTLTGLPNRTSFLDRLDLELAHARRRDTRLALLFVDLNRFKEINDTHGHGVGDQLLASVAERLRGSLREDDTVARLGGDEFTLLLPEVQSVDAAVAVARKLVRRLDRPHRLNGLELLSGASVGVALFPTDARDAEGLMRLADQGMYRAKAAGGGVRRPGRRPSHAPTEEAPA